MFACDMQETFVPHCSGKLSVVILCSPIFTFVHLWTWRLYCSYNVCSICEIRYLKF